MAYLRRGLVTNKGAVPSVHTRTTVLRLVIDNDEAQNDDDIQPSIIIKKVAKILKMAMAAGEHHLVQLECGHTARSKSTFQGYCTKCKAVHA